jgi:hypothetical protein
MYFSYFQNEDVVCCQARILALASIALIMAIATMEFVFAWTDGRVYFVKEGHVLWIALVMVHAMTQGFVIVTFHFLEKHVL